MNNLKRVLSLGLAGAMLSGMMLVGASAASTSDFSDADEITHVEAVNTMAALGVIKGKDTGAFDPNGIVTRAEMAKIICVMLNGGEDPTLGTKTTPTYSDIKGHWAESYIEYCSSLGIISGQGDGTFAPDATVTGSQAAKMMLVALGYDSKVFGFTGIDWEINVNVSANDAKLYDQIKSVDVASGLSRDNAAQMACNALDAYVMVRSYDSVQSTGEITYKYSLSTTKTFLNDKFGAQTFVGTYLGNYNSGAATTDGEIKLNGKLDTDDGSSSGQRDRDAFFPSDLGIENIGEEIKVIFKDGTGSRANEPDKKDTIYGVFNTGASEVYNVTLSDIKTGSGAAKDADKIKLGDNEYTVETATNDPVVAVVVNYGAGSSISVDADASETATMFNSYKGAFESLGAQSGDTVKFVTNPDNGKIAKAYVTNSSIGTVTAKNSDKITISGLGSIKVADHDIYEGVAKDDVVVYTKLYNSSLSNSKCLVKVEKAEKISGEVTGFTAATASTTEKVVLDGDSYKVAYKAAMPTSVAGDTGTDYFTKSDIGETFDLYLVNGMVGAAVKTTESASNYSLVLEVGGTSTTSNMDPLKATFMDAAGTKTTLNISDKSSTAGKALAAGDIVTYTVVDGKAKVTVKAAWSAKSTGDTSVLYNKSDKTFAGVVTSTDCVLFTTKTTGDVASAGASKPVIVSEPKAQNIRGLKDITANSKNYVYVTNDDGKVVAAFINLQASVGVSTADTVFGMVTATNGTVEIDDVYYNQYIVWAGEEITVNIDTDGSDGNGADSTLAKGSIYGFVVNSDNKYDDSTGFKLVSKADLAKSDVSSLDGFTETKASADAVAVKNYDESEQLLTYYTTRTGDSTSPVDTSVVVTKAVADDVKIIYVDVDGNKAGDDIGVGAYDAVNNYFNALIFINDDGVISHIVVETSGEGNVYDV